MMVLVPRFLAHRSPMCKYTPSRKITQKLQILSFFKRAEPGVRGKGEAECFDAKWTAIEDEQRRSDAILDPSPWRWLLMSSSCTRLIDAALWRSTRNLRKGRYVIERASEYRLDEAPVR
eukprot:gnl/TRDRNA2_/TRDRNA2_137986_c1_seq1.p2 gnl/TRDRNA2_/TRDRNA2_137986_c1~~gnl/TRDRNA2_/TRDRNA2_137986_c1_seq1.p2  ORF type:complete len:119 (-),score=10.19 gnl/TRDRNA2_/TRDRNA2_137986_c1_seq1:149-505(-)